MKSYGSAVMNNELTAMAWERVIMLHPKREDELRELWLELRKQAGLILREPSAYQELVRRVETRNAEIQAEMELIDVQAESV